jgi:GTP cyclohydrolase I
MTEAQREIAEDSIRTFLAAIGENVEREGLVDTPMRYTKFMREFMAPKEFKLTTFDAEGTDEMIVQTRIPFYSLCEHHMAPFFGHAAVAYIPKGRIVGLSKLARTVDHFAQRLQNQERITSQVADFLQQGLNPTGVAVQLTAQHLCMSMRGVQKHGAMTTTTKLIGAFHTDDKARAEFLQVVSLDRP